MPAARDLTARQGNSSPSPGGSTSTCTRSCASDPPQAPTEFVHFAVGPAGVVRSDSWRGEYAAQPEVSCPLELARVCITERDASEAELTVTLGILVVRDSGEVTLDGRRVALRAESVQVEQLGAPAHRAAMNYETAERVGEVAQNVLLGIGVLATFGMLVAFSEPCAPIDVSAPDL